jgi:hypothetical protein
VKRLSKNLKIRIYRTIILPVVLFGCEAWSLTLKEERRLRVFQNRVLRRIFGRNMNICRVSYWWPTWKSEELTHFGLENCRQSSWPRGDARRSTAGGHGAADSELSAKARLYHLLVHFTFLASEIFVVFVLKELLWRASFHLQ